MAIAGQLILALGALILLLAAIGLHTLPDALSRQHAATTAGSLGIAGIVAGAALIGGDAAWIGRALALIAIVWLTMPVASHVLARAAYGNERQAALARSEKPSTTRKKVRNSRAPTKKRPGKSRVKRSPGR